MSLATQPLSELNNQLRFAHIRVAKPMATLFYDGVIGDIREIGQSTEATKRFYVLAGC